MGVTSIEWTATQRPDGSWAPGYTFNPWIGCAKVSPGCTNCYAAVDTFPRVQRSKGIELWGIEAERHVTSDANWQKPRRWNLAAKANGERQRVFCASMADVFEERLDLVEPRARLFQVIEDTPHLDWLILTKRPENIRRLMPGYYGGESWPNIWMGTTTEDQTRYDQRIGHLLRAPAAVRFVSYEPALGPLDLRMGGMAMPDYSAHDPLPKLDWLICGGESGPDARPFNLEWARSIVRQCEAAGVRVFVKQLGAKPYEKRQRPVQVFGGLSGEPIAFDVCVPMKDKKGGDIEEFPPDLRVRQFPDVRA